MTPSQKCTICGEMTGNLNNHTRMSSGEGHGPQGDYPEGWDKDDPEAFEGDHAEPDEGNEQSPAESGPAGSEDPSARGNHTGGQVDLDLAGDNVDPDADNEGEELVFGDSMADKREYECGNCGEPLSYLGGDDHPEGGMACPECGERLYWSVMQ